MHRFCDVIRVKTEFVNVPLLKPEIDLYPDSLLTDLSICDKPWWAMYTLARQEKKLMRSLVELEIPFYGPTVARRYRAPNGRLRQSIEPLFPTMFSFVGKRPVDIELFARGRSVAGCRSILHKSFWLILYR